jgi:hypothetical protein
MELSPARQKLLFVLIVVVLAVLGYYLVVPAVHHRDAAAPAASRTPAVTTSPAPAVSAVPAVTQTQTAGQVNIYSWLPFTQQNLAAAAQVAVQVGVEYNTFTYTENAAAYTGKMGDLITSELAATLQNGYSTPGVATLRTSEQQASSGTATINQIRAFGPGSLTFVVDLTQRLVSSNKTTSSSQQWALTLTGDGDSWQVNDIEPATEGNT